MSKRAQHEILHGEYLAGQDTESVWGWGTPAGQVRARRRAALISKGACLGRTSKALEIGCGTGLFTEMFAQSGCTLLAVDVSASLLEKAKARSLPENRVRFLEKPFEETGVDGPFDAIIGSSVLHHLDLGLALPKIHNLLKSGGILCFAEPNMLNPQVFAERKFRRFFPQVSLDETAFIRWQMKKNLKETGFENIRITPFDFLHPAVPAPLIGLVSTIGRIIEWIPVFREFSGSLLITARRQP